MDTRGPVNQKFLYNRSRQFLLSCYSCVLCESIMYSLGCVECSFSCVLYPPKKIECAPNLSGWMVFACLWVVLFLHTDACKIVLPGSCLSSIPDMYLEASQCAILLAMVFIKIYLQHKYALLYTNCQSTLMSRRPVLTLQDDNPLYQWLSPFLELKARLTSYSCITVPLL